MMGNNADEPFPHYLRLRAERRTTGTRRRLSLLCERGDPRTVAPLYEDRSCPRFFFLFAASFETMLQIPPPGHARITKP